MIKEKKEIMKKALKGKMKKETPAPEVSAPMADKYKNLKK